MKYYRRPTRGSYLRQYVSFPRQTLEMIRYKVCDRWRLWKIGDWAVKHLPKRLGDVIFQATLPF